MTDNNAETDIFAPPAPAPEDEKTIALKREVDQLRVQLHAMIQSAPSEDDETLYLGKEDWCRGWKRLINSLTTRVQLARQTKIDVQLNDADRQDGLTGQKIYDKLQRQVSSMKEAAAMQADKDAQAKLPGEQDRQAQAEKDLAVVGDEEEALNTKDKDDVQDDLHHDAQEHGAQAHDAQENSDKDTEVPVEEPPIKRSTRIDCGKTITPHIPSDPDLEMVFPKKKIPRMSTKQQAANAIPCTKCASAGRMCYSIAVGLVCMDCKRLKIRCSLVPAKSKCKQKPTPPPNPTPAPTATATSAPKPRPTPVLRPSLTAKAGPAPKATPAPAPAPKGRGKAEDLSAVVAAPQRTAPGPLGTLRPYVDIKVNSKRKFVEIEEDSSESEHDGDDEDAYMAGRLNGLHTFVGMFETAFGALKKEVTEIDGYLARKRRRRHRH
ncbi:hypothetical protein BDR05DRAFT_1005424 [Suillus weaverae]|nr:hypothetical protein BDR05DRAFT_1005424 [Suillus weaverae]